MLLHSLNILPTGVFTQLSIVVGIMITQLIGFKLATPTAWRYVLLLSGLAAIFQFLISPTMIESPVWAVRNGDPQSGKTYYQRLWKGVDSHCMCVAPLHEPGLTRIPQHQMRTHCSSKTPTMDENALSASHTLSRRANYDYLSQPYPSL
jgi:MFS family permease